MLNVGVQSELPERPDISSLDYNSRKAFSNSIRKGKSALLHSAIRMSNNSKGQAGVGLLKPNAVVLTDRQTDRQR